MAHHLREYGYGVTVRGTTPSTLLTSLRETGAYDAVIGTTRAGAIAGTLVRLVHRVPLIVDHIDPISQFRRTHPDWLATLVETAENIAFTQSSATMFVYEEEQSRVEARAPVALKTYLGVDYDRFADPGADVLAVGRDLLPSDVEPPVAVYVGGLEPLYNVETMLSAGTDLETGSLVVAGAGSLADAAERTAARSETVHYLGTVPHKAVPGFLAACDVGLSLVDDPHTLKVLEYGAAGLPVVQLDGRARERFEDRVTYATADADAVVQAIAIASERDSEQLRTYVSRFDWADIAETYATAIEQVF